MKEVKVTVTLDFSKLLLGMFHVLPDYFHLSCFLARSDPVCGRGPLFSRPDLQYRETGLSGQWNETVTHQLCWLVLRYSVAGAIRSDIGSE